MNHTHERRHDAPHGLAWHALGELTLRGASDDEHQATAWIADTVREVGMSPAQLERVGTDVAEAVRNARKQGRRTVSIRVLTSAEQHPRNTAGQKRVEQPAPRGWGAFILQKREVDGHEANGTSEGGHHMIELFLYPEGGEDRAAYNAKETT